MPSVHDGLLAHLHSGPGSRGPSFGPPSHGPHPHHTMTHGAFGVGRMPVAHARRGLELYHHAGQEDVMPAAGSGESATQTNYTPVSSGPLDGGLLGSLGGSPGTIASSLLGSLSGVFGGGGGSTSTSAPSSASSTSQANIPTSYTIPGAGPVTPVAPHPASTTIVPATAAPKSHLLWWILGGAAAVVVTIVAWRMFGHHGAKTAAKGAAKAASYYGAFGL